MSLYAYADFEYRATSEPLLDVVCCAVLIRENGVTLEENVYWVHESFESKQQLSQKFIDLIGRGCIFVSYNAIAEAGACISLGMLPELVTEMKWIDLLLEVKQVRNGNYKRLYGKYVDKKGEKKTSYPPMVDERGKAVTLDKKDPRKKNNSKTNVDLSSTLWAYLGVEPELQHKNAMRDLILRGNYSEEEKQEIIKYAASDVVHLPDLFKVLQGEIRTLTRQTFDKYLDSAFVRGEWAARLAAMERLGIPIQRERLERVAGSREEILDEWISHLCDNYFPFYEKDKKGKWVFKDAKKQEFVESKGLQNEWPKSKKTGKYSFASEVTDEYEELYVEVKELSRIRNFDNQSKAYSSKTTEFVNVLYEGDDNDEESVEGKETIFKRIGTDGRLRCYFNPYGSQTSRNQPPARNFILAQAKWLRSCMRPPEGWCYTAVDYSSEEFLIAACEANDENMMKAYDMKTGGGDPDVYVNFGILAGVLPPNATKKSHPELRKQLKSLVLGMQFGMGVAKLHRKLVADTGDKTITVERAQELHSHHKDTFDTYWSWSRDKLEEYSYGTPMKTRDGWYLFTDNPNQMSVANFPIQGAGGAILRRAVQHAQRAGINVASSLHDALYCIHLEEDTERTVEVLKECMNRAFQDFYCRDIRMDHKTWGHRDEFIDEGALHTFALLSKYFMTEAEHEAWPLLTNIIGE